MKTILKDFIFYFINNLLNRMPSRRLRMFVYNKISKNRISKKASIGLRVTILDIRGIEIGDYTNVNFDCILDGRGSGIVIRENVDIAPQVNIWSLGHDPKSAAHETTSKKVIIEDGCWLANRVTVLPGTVLARNSVVAAGATVHGCYHEMSLIKSEKAKVRGYTFSEKRIKLRKIRRFR